MENPHTGILFTCEKHLHDYIISLRGKVWAHKTSLTQPLYIEVPVSSQESERSCMYVLAISFCLCFYNISVGSRKCDDSVVYFVFLLDLGMC